MNEESKKTMHHGATAVIFKNAEVLRKNLTPAEQRLWTFLSEKQLNDLKFRQQHPMGNYIADFYCHSKKLVIELDGKYHEEEYQKLHDKFRDSEMENQGIKVLRFTNEEIFDDIEKVLEEIKLQAEI